MQQTHDKRANRWLARLAESNHVLWLIFTLSLLESIIVPIPLELILIPLLLSQQHRLWAISTATLAGCLVGATIGYFVGFWFFDDVGQWLLQILGYEDAFASFSERFQEQGFGLLLLVGITPIPFQVGMLSAGSTGYPYGLFITAAIIARGIRYYGLALLVYWFGDKMLDVWQRYSHRVGWVLAVLGLSALTWIWIGA
ncbi:YqaA family protein [Pseudidiomarina aestuarii]|uniref:YqaA family protein n=1 Tax=Pseudidiomarina aestuarii TaxID=624146 RepID=UPI003A96CCD7